MKSVYISVGSPGCLLSTCVHRPPFSRAALAPDSLASDPTTFVTFFNLHAELSHFHVKYNDFFFFSFFSLRDRTRKTVQGLKQPIKPPS